MKEPEKLLDKLQELRRLDHGEWLGLLGANTPQMREAAGKRARMIAQKYFGNGIFVRGIVEFSNWCVNDCLYCGIRRSNRKACRYRMTEDEILKSCEEGFYCGFRTFVLQSGEDPVWAPESLAGLVRDIKSRFPECAVTLSVGELDEPAYRLLFEAGCDRYLLRHETADPEHYAQLHPASQSWERRMNCLKLLKSIGFQTGCGFMVGSPGQTLEHLAKDMEFISDFHPHMVGIGPFIPHNDTPFAGESSGSGEMTLFLLSLLRIMQPDLLLPATTALGTLIPGGRELGVLAGANVIMPDITPQHMRDKYFLYNNKQSTDTGSAGVMHSDLQKRLEKIGYTIKIGRGDHISC